VPSDLPHKDGLRMRCTYGDTQAPSKNLQAQTTTEKLERQHEGGTKSSSKKESPPGYWRGFLLEHSDGSADHDFLQPATVASKALEPNTCKDMNHVHWLLYSLSCLLTVFSYRHFEFWLADEIAGADDECVSNIDAC
jgi:hypothetical protein